MYQVLSLEQRARVFKIQDEAVKVNPLIKFGGVWQCYWDKQFCVLLWGANTRFAGDSLKAFPAAKTVAEAIVEAELKVGLVVLNDEEPERWDGMS